MSTTSIASLIIDNPIITKDGFFALRKKKMLGLLGASSVIVAVVSVLLWLDDKSVLRYNPEAVVGDQLFEAMFGLAFIIAGVFLPAMASATIAGEREHGTLPLLTVAGLSPSRIVVGKIAAMLVVAAPFVALPLPSILIGAIAIGVPPVALGVSVLGLVVSMVAFASVGVYASALNERSRTSAPGAMLGAAVPAVFCAMPSFALAIDATDGAHAVHSFVAAIGGIIAGVIVAGAAAYGAWSTLAPQSTPRFRQATGLFLAVTVGMPWVAALLSLTVTTSGRKDVVAGFVAGTFAYSVAALMLYAAGVARDARAPSPWLIVPGAFVVALVSSGLALLASADANHDPSLSQRETISFAVAMLQLFAATTASALAARFIKSPILAALASGLAVLIVTLVPAVIDEFTVGQPPLAFVNFAYARKPEEMVLALLFWGTASIACLAIASRLRASRQRAATGA